MCDNHRIILCIKSPFCQRPFTLWWGKWRSEVEIENGKCKMAATSNCQGIDTDLMTLWRIEKKWQPPTRCEVQRAWREPCVSLLVVRRHSPFYDVVRFAASISESWRDEDQESSVICDPLVSCNSCLQHQSMRLLLSYITSLPLSANGSAIQFHTSALRGEATLTRGWGSMLQRRRAVVWRGLEARWSGGGKICQRIRLK